MIDLSKAVLVGTGNERLCYVHPADPTKVVKVQRGTERARQQNRMEEVYIRSLVRRGVPLDHIPRVDGLEPTSAGEGLVCERIVDADGGTTRRLSDVLRSGGIARAEAELLLAGLRTYLERHAIVFADAGVDNLLCQRLAGGWRLVIVDGLGARRPGLRFWLQRTVLVLARRKLRKQWRNLLADLWAGDAGPG